MRPADADQKPNRCVIVAGRAYCGAVHFLGAEALVLAKSCRFYRSPLDGYAHDCNFQHRGYNVACQCVAARNDAPERGKEGGRGICRTAI